MKENSTSSYRGKYQNLAVQKRILRIMFLTLSLSRTFQFYQRKLRLSQLFDRFAQFSRLLITISVMNSYERKFNIELPREISKSRSAKENLTNNVSNVISFSYFPILSAKTAAFAVVSSIWFFLLHYFQDY